MDLVSSKLLIQRLANSNNKLSDLQKFIHKSTNLKLKYFILQGDSRYTKFFIWDNFPKILIQWIYVKEQLFFTKNLTSL